MKRYRIEYTGGWRHGPMSFWVHVPADGKPWYAAAIPMVLLFSRPQEGTVLDLPEQVLTLST